MGLFGRLVLLFVLLWALTVPVARLVADPTLCHLLELLDRHLELALTKRWDTGASCCHRSPRLPLVVVPAAEFLGLFRLQRLGVGLPLLLEVGVRDLSRLVLFKGLVIANLRAVLAVLVLQVT